MAAEQTVLVGQRIRALRERQGLSLRAVAERCGLSINAISQIERGENSPTVSSLHLLATALGVSITDLFREEDGETAVFVRPRDRLRTEANGTIMESLGIGLPYQQLEPFLVTVAGGAGNAEQPVTHAGEEFVYCLQGEVDYRVGDQTFHLAPGFSLLFDATRLHHFHNPTEGTARLLLVFLSAGERHVARQLHAGATQATPGGP